MAEHRYLADVEKYAGNANPDAVMGIARYCGIALRRSDSRYVACSDKSERDAVRDGFLKKKLALKMSDAELDKAILDVCQKMKATRRKPRVTFYYLLAEKFGKTSIFT